MVSRSRMSGQLDAQLVLAVGDLAVERGGRTEDAEEQREHRITDRRNRPVRLTMAKIDTTTATAIPSTCVARYRSTASAFGSPA